MKTLQDNNELEQVNETDDGELNEEDLNDEDLNEEDFDDEESNDETDEEIRNIMSKHDYEPINFEENCCIVSENKKIIKKIKNVKTIDDCIKEDNALKPTKWSSGRAVNKKKVNNGVDEIKRREFRPRLEPFRNIDKKQFFDLSFFELQNNECFPDLKINNNGSEIVKN